MIRLIFVAIAAISICNGCTEKQLQQTLRDPGAIPSGTEISGRYSLVEIASMDDSIYTPGPGSRYILDFQQDNELVIIDDCNHGQANWTVTAPSGLIIDTVITTSALCRTSAVHDRFLRDLEYVRSYVWRDGHLFLATMADGAILEFAPIQAGMNQLEGDAVLTSTDKVISYRCENGQPLTATFYNDTQPRAMSIKTGADKSTQQTSRLEAVRSGSGAKYSGNGLTFWTQGDEAILETSDQASVTCAVVR